MDNRCVCCGEIIPEGRQVCPQCWADMAALSYENGDQDVTKRGQWEKPEKYGLAHKFTHLGAVCPNCCSWFKSKHNQCPKCGADMRGAENG